MRRRKGLIFQHGKIASAAAGCPGWKEREEKQITDWEHWEVKKFFRYPSENFNFKKNWASINCQQLLNSIKVDFILSLGDVIQKKRGFSLSVHYNDRANFAMKINWLHLHPLWDRLDSHLIISDHRKKSFDSSSSFSIVTPINFFPF